MVNSDGYRMETSLLFVEVLFDAGKQANTYPIVTLKIGALHRNFDDLFVVSSIGKVLGFAAFMDEWK